MLNAMSQGRAGSMCTIHADSSAGVFRRIASYAVQAPEHLPLEASNLLIAGAIHLVVHLESELRGESVFTALSGTSSRSGGSFAGVGGKRSESGFQHLFPAQPDRRRFVSSIREVVDAEGAQVISNEVFRPGPDRQAVVAAPLRAETIAELRRFGYQPGTGDFEISA